MKRLPIIVLAIVCLTAAPGCVPWVSQEQRIAAEDDRAQADAAIAASEAEIAVMMDEYATATPQRRSELVRLVFEETASQAPWHAKGAKAEAILGAAKVQDDLIETGTAIGTGLANWLLPGSGVLVAGIMGTLAHRERKKTVEAKANEQRAKSQTNAIVNGIEIAKTTNDAFREAFKSAGPTIRTAMKSIDPTAPDAVEAATAVQKITA